MDLTAGTDQFTLTLSGSLKIEGKNLIMTFDGGFPGITFKFELSNNTLTLTSDDANYDFDSNGTEEPATNLIVLQKS
ncbi:MAG: hypothetical protein ACE5IR_23510 [bacterium]